MHLFQKILRRLGLASHLNYTATTRMGERTFKIPLIGELGYANLEGTEPWMASLLGKLGRVFSDPSAVFVDVGINIGQTLLKLRSVHPNVAYVGFEPNPTCFYYASSLVKVNAFDRVRMYPVGVSSEAAILELQLFGKDDLDASASLVADFRPTEKVYQRINVPVFSTEKIDFGGRVTFLKIDVEGAELEVIQGCQDLIRKDNPFILMEILPTYTAENTARIQRQQALQDLLRSLNYACFRVIKTEQNQFSALQKLDAIEIHGEIALSDYVWVPQSEVSQIADFAR